MKANSRMLVLSMASFVLLVACDKQPEPKVATPPAASSAPAPGPAPTPVPPPTAGSTPSAGTSAPSSGDAATPTQANPAPLTKEQEQKSMPHTGQANTHSPPETVGEKK